MTTALIISPSSSGLPQEFPILEAGASEAMQQFFDAVIDNPRTRRAYVAAAADFFRYAIPFMTSGLSSLNALHVAGWIGSMKARALSTPTIKQRLAGLRMLFQALTREQIIKSNPAAIVRGPKHTVIRGKTPVLDRRRNTPPAKFHRYVYPDRPSRSRHDRRHGL